MVSLLITTSNIIAYFIRKQGTKYLFTIPLEIENGGIAGVAERCKSQLVSMGIKSRKVTITLLENIVYKEFSHMPASEKAVAGFADLEARTVLREQANMYSVEYLRYGTFKNRSGEETDLLLATPKILLQSLLAGFATSGFSIERLHSGFDSFTAACAAAALPAMGDKCFVALDFGYEHTLINVYSNGLLASQRRLHGFSSSLIPLIMKKHSLSEAEALNHLITTDFSFALDDAEKEAITGFVWDILRTVRVVCAPLGITIEEFFLSGDGCQSSDFNAIVDENFSLPLTYANDLNLSALSCTTPSNGMFIHGGAILSQKDLLSQLRVAKKNNIFDLSVCAVLTIIIALGLLAQPFAVVLKQTMLSSATQRYEALLPIQNAFDELTAINTKLRNINIRLDALDTYSSNVGTTLAEVESLFQPQGLSITNLVFDGTTGLYNVYFTADSKETFLILKDSIYSNPNYFLNLTLSSTLEDQSNKYNCVLTFTPSTHKMLPLPAEEPTTPEEVKPEDLLAEVVK